MLEGERLQVRVGRLDDVSGSLRSSGWTRSRNEAKVTGDWGGSPKSRKAISSDQVTTSPAMFQPSPVRAISCASASIARA